MVLHILCNLRELEEWKHYSNDNRSYERSDEDDNKWFERGHQIGDESFQFFGVVLSNFLYILSDGTSFFPDTDHMNKIFRKECVGEYSFLIASDSQSHGITKLNTSLHLIFNADNIFLELDIRNDICCRF